MTIRVIVTGDEKLAAQFRQLAAMDKLEEAKSDVGRSTQRLARGLAPVKTGRLKRSVRYKTNRDKVVISAGGGRAYYGPYVHFGLVGNPAQPFLFTAFAAVEGKIIPVVDRSLGKSFTRVGL